MRYLLVILCFVVLSIFSSQAIAQDTITAGPRITFKEKMVEYGDIVYGDSISYTFVFTNTGNQDLIIKNVVTTCSCTSRTYTEGPIAPGKSGELLVKFNSKNQDKIGRQNKVITILSNAVNNPERVILSITILEK